MERQYPAVWSYGRGRGRGAEPLRGEAARKRKRFGRGYIPPRQAQNNTPRSAVGRPVEIDAPSRALRLGPDAGEAHGGTRTRRPMETGIRAESRHVRRTRRHGPIRPRSVGEGASRMVGRVSRLGSHAREEHGRARARRPLEIRIGMRAREVWRHGRSGVIRSRSVRMRSDGMRFSGVRTRCARRGKSGAGGRRNVPRRRGWGGQERRAQQKTAACLFQEVFHDSFREFFGLVAAAYASPYAPRPVDAMSREAGSMTCKT